MKRTKKGLKKGLDINLSQEAQLEAFKNTAKNPRYDMPLYNLGSNLVRVFGIYSTSQIYLSTNKVSLAALGPASVEISLSNITVSPSETSMDVLVKNPASNTAPVRTHLSLATGILLQELEGQLEAQWYFFWNAFFEHTQINNWLKTNITNVNPAVISPEKSLELLQAPIKNSNFLSNAYLKQARIDAQRILNKVSYPIPFDQIQCILISQDESKIWFKTIEIETSIWNQEDYTTEKEWLFSKNDNNWLFIKGEALMNYFENEEDSIEWKISFYRNAFDLNQTLWSYNEAEWTQIVVETIDHYGSIQFKHIISSEADHQLIEQYIKPQLYKHTQQDTYTYSQFYQRQSPEYGEFSEDDDRFYTTTDFLISNPEKTAFIYPVLLHHKEEQDRDDNYTNEDFKFYVLLKNSDGSFTLNDWLYFKNLPYKNYYSLTNCVESHLKNITDYNAGQEIISDTNFWNAFVFKKSDRGFNYLIPVVSQNETVSISKAEFEAQVADCIHLLTEFDVVDLYPHQLLQIIRCYNTIQMNANSSANCSKLISICNDFNFQGRLNRIQKHNENYYPNLGVSWKTNLSPNCYYLIK
ncbi:MAG: hypothetical protein ACKOWW_01035 [Flavobacteriales bacterium]